MLLANPVSRGRVLLEKLAAMTAGIVLLAGVTGAALLLESPMADMRLPAGPIIAAMAVSRIGLKRIAPASIRSSTRASPVPRARMKLPCLPMNSGVSRA